MIRENRNSALGGWEWIAFRKRDYLADAEHEVGAGKDMGARHAIFLKLTTATAAIVTLMARLNLGTAGRDDQSFSKATLRYRHIVQREHKQKVRNELDPTVHDGLG